MKCSLLPPLRAPSLPHRQYKWPQTERGLLVVLVLVLVLQVLVLVLQALLLVVLLQVLLLVLVVLVLQ